MHRDRARSYLLAFLIGISSTAFAKKNTGVPFDRTITKSEIVRHAGFSDPLMKEIAGALLGVISRPPEASDRLFVFDAPNWIYLQ